MRALFVFGALIAWFTWEAFGGETPFSYFGVGSSVAASLGALFFSLGKETVASKISKKL